MYRVKHHKTQNTLGIVLIILMFSINTAWALPKDGTVVAGSSTITQPAGTTLNITQSTDKSIINWQGYSIGKGETVQYFQPGSSSISLNRVTGADPSLIYGNLIANGGVWVINPNGLLVGKNAKINVGSFLGSTLDINNEDFLSGKYLFRNTTNSLSSITNKGEITTEAGGYLVLISPSITNKGKITTQEGKTYMASGDEVTLSFAGNSLIGFTIDKETAQNALGIINTGKIIADGGEVILSAKSAGDVFKTVVNNKGIIRAQTIEDKNGTIKLLGGMKSNTVKVGGTLDASAPDGGNGGFIETSAANVKVADKAVVTTAATEGTAGTWLIDPYDFMIATSGGDITGAALGTALGAGDVTIQTLAGSVSCTGVTCGSGTSTGNGDIIVNDNITWSAHKLTLNAYRNIEINKELFGSGTAQLALYYGQGAVASGNTAVYKVNAPVNLSAGYNFSTTLGSNGAPKNYYVITTLGAEGSTTGTDLQGMNNGLSGNYALGSNIDATITSTWNPNGSGGYYGFAPIGNNSAPFAGRFDGLGHTISNLYINRPADAYVGLFGYTRGSTCVLQNIGITGGSVTGGTYVGGLVGYNNDGTISNSYATGSVSGGDDSLVGGLVGYNYDGTISNSYATGSVSGGDDSLVGGLSGQNDYGNITNSYATGSVSGGDRSTVGGLVGYNYGTVSNSYATGSVTGGRNGFVGGLAGANYNGTITNSYATGSVSGGNVSNIGGLAGANNSSISNSYATGSVSGGDESTVGGLAGFNHSSGSISNSYATGSVSGGNVSNIGGLVGENYSDSISNSYWDTVTTGQATSDGGTGLTTAQMMQTANFSGWDFSDVWWLSPGNTRPFLQMEYSNTIVNAHQLQLMAMDLGASYTLGADIDMAELTNPSGMWGTASATVATGITKGFTPIGTDYNTPFTGKFDGLGHTISNLYINRPAEAYVGLFGYTGGFTCILQNIGLTGGSVTGNSYVGGLAGYNSYGTITNVYNTGSVTGTGSGMHWVGGLFGDSGGPISNSYATGSVSSSCSDDSQQNVGGLAGGSHDTVTNCHASGNVTVSGSGNQIIGGLLGNSGMGTVVTDSYATGNVSGSGVTGISNSILGGLIGWFDMASTLSNSYATGNVIGGDQSRVGGLVGYNLSNTINGSYATGSVSGGEFSRVGGLVGYNLSNTINDSYATGSVIGGNDSWVGGLVGYSVGENSRSISNSHAAGSVIGGKDSVVGGLVGYSDADITNSYASGSVTGGSVSLVGGLAGYNESARHITDSHASGNVSGGDNSNVGGLVGYNDPTKSITDSYATGSVSGGESSDVGGLVGYNCGTITNSYATGSVCGENNNQVGGLAGYNSGNITNTYATGSVGVSGYDGDNRVGGLVGRNYGTISNSYATGSVSGVFGGDSGYVGGLVGYNDGSITNSFWNIASYYTGVGGGTGTGVSGVTAAQMMTQATFITGSPYITGTGWDIANAGGSSAVWRIYEGYTYPLLRSFLTPLTITADNFSTTYNGSAYTGALSNVSYSVPGADTSGHLLGTGTPYGSGKNVGTNALKLYSDQQGYDISYVNGNLTINPLALTGSIGTGSSVYGSALSPGTATFTNAVAGDDLGTATVEVDTTGRLSSGGKLKAGNHTGIEYITALSGADAGNYTFANVHGDYNVSKLALTGSISAGSSVYGSVLAPGAASLSGAISGDALGTATVEVDTTGNVSTSGNLNAGSYTGIEYVSALSGADAGNYSFANVHGDYTVSKLALTGAAIASGSSAYGSDLAPGAVTFDNAVNDDDVTGTAIVNISTLSTGSKPVVGTYTQTADAISGADAGNYTFAGFTTATENYTINPLAITGNITAGNKTYDTTTAATITGRSLTGALDGDLVSYTGGKAAFDNKNAGTGKTVTATGLSLTGADAGNYTVNTTAATKATITPAALTIAANDDSKTYNGHAYSGGNGVTYNGFAGGETESVLSGTLAYGGTSQGAVNAGSYTIIPSGLTSGNYSINYINGTLTINRALLTVISGSLTGSVAKVYDGTNVATLSPSNYILSGWAGTDGATVNKTTGTYDTANAGTNKTVTVSLAAADYTALGSTKLSNYILPAAITGSVGVITPAPLTITANNAGKTYDGLAYSGGNGVTYSGFVGGQNSPVLSGSLAYGGTSQGAISAGNYTIIPSGLTSGNYTINYVNGTLNISAQNIFHPVWDMYWLLDMENNEGGNPLNNMNLAGLFSDGFFKPHDRHWTIEGNISGLPGQEDEDKKRKKTKIK